MVSELRLKALQAWKQRAHKGVEGAVASRVNKWNTTILTAAALYQESYAGTKLAVRKINERAVRDFWLLVNRVNKGVEKIFEGMKTSFDNYTLHFRSRLTKLTIGGDLLQKNFLVVKS